MSEDFDALWSSIVASPMRTIYMDELYSTARGVVDSIELLFANASPAVQGPTVIPVDHGYLRVSRSLVQLVYSILGSAVRLKALIEPRRKNRYQTREQHEIQVRRARWLGDEVLQGLSFDEIMKADVRDSLEHFDEFVDRSALACLHKEIPRPTFLSVGTFVSDRDVWKELEPMKSGGTLHELRTYIESEQVFVNFGLEIHLGRLKDECMAIRDSLLPQDPSLASGGDASSYGVVLFEGSFPGADARPGEGRECS